MIKNNPDSSLFGWGRNLRSVPVALDEISKAAQAAESQIEVAAAACAALTTQGETEQVADARLTAELESITAELKQIQDAAYATRLRQLASRAEGLYGMYSRLHEADEGRLNGERGGRMQEKRADVAAGEVDT